MTLVNALSATQINPRHLPLDYAEGLQQAALAFLQRRQAQHLGEQVLFSLTVEHLMNSFSAARAMAENVTARAYGQLHSAGPNRYADMSLSNSNVIILVDADTGAHFTVAVSLIFERLIDTQQRRRLTAVDNVS